MFTPTVLSRKKRKSDTPIPSESNEENKKSKTSEDDSDEKIQTIEEENDNIEENDHIEEEESVEKNNEDDLEKKKRLRTLKEIMKQKPSGRPTKAYLEKAAERKNRKSKKSEIKKEEEVIKEPPIKSPPPTETVSQSNTNFTPQLRIVDGRIEIDQSSLVIPQVTEEVQRDIVHENRTHITSGTYLKKSPSEKWTPEEIETFYKAIRQCGTDFSLVERFFPNRSRRQIKNRYKKEEKTNPSKIDEALRNRMPLDVEFLKATMTEK